MKNNISCKMSQSLFDANILREKCCSCCSFREAMAIPALVFYNSHSQNSEMREAEVISATYFFITSNFYRMAHPSFFKTSIALVVPEICQRSFWRSKLAVTFDPFYLRERFSKLARVRSVLRVDAEIGIVIFSRNCNSENGLAIMLY